MGLRLFGRSFSTYDRPAVSVWDERTQSSLPNPKPDNYSITRSQQVGNNLVVEIKYHDCINYEGRKILIYRNTNINDLTKQGNIDPHFSDSKRMKSPFIRVEPTEYGWNIAIEVAKIA